MNIEKRQKRGKKLLANAQVNKLTFVEQFCKRAIDALPMKILLMRRNGTPSTDIFGLGIYCTRKIRNIPRVLTIIYFA